MLPVSYNNSSQYSLSLHSLSAISNFEIKSFVPCAYCASCTFAPTDVPERNSWLIKAASTLFCFNLRQRNTMFLANSLDLFLKTLSVIPASCNFKLGEANHNLPKAIITDNSFRRWRMRSYEFRVMNLASPNVMRVLRTRYDMIALLLQTAPKVHHNYAKRIITLNSP